MPEELEEEGSSKLREILSPVIKPFSEAVKKIGLAKIILFVIAAALILWFISLPKPGNLFITVIELDGTQSVEGALVSLQWPDGQLIGDLFTSVTDSSGVASFTNVPGERDITIYVEGTGEFDSARLDTQLASGENKNELVKLPRAAQGIALYPATLTGIASETCVREAIITVTNNGENNVDAVFVGGGALQGAVSSQQITVFPGASENATVFIDVSKTRKRQGETLTGELRIKGTNKRVTVNMLVSEAPKVTVSPSLLACSSNRPVCPQIVTIQNNGDNTLSNLRIEPSASVAAVIENGDVERYYQTDSIPPGGEAKFGARLIGSSTPTIGVITVKADCFIKQIDVQVG